MTKFRAHIAIATGVGIVATSKYFDKSFPLFVSSTYFTRRAAFMVAGIFARDERFVSCAYRTPPITSTADTAPPTRLRLTMVCRQKKNRCFKHKSGGDT